MRKDYYIVLGVHRGADTQKIKKAYRTVAKKYHPDLSHSPESARKFMEMKEAYETLGDEKKRRRYDEEIARKERTLRVNTEPDIVRRGKSVFDETDSFFFLVDEFFSGFLPGFFNRGMGKDLYLEAILTPGEASRGGLFPIAVPVIERCSRCYQTGWEEEFLCPVCYGYGKIQSERELSVSIPPHVTHGTQITVSMEDIGLRDAYLRITVYGDSST